MAIVAQAAVADGARRRAGAPGPELDRGPAADYDGAMRRPCVDVVFFDLGGVLADVDLDRMRAAWQRHTGVPPERLDALLFDSGLKDAMDTGRCTPAKVAATLCDHVPDLQPATFRAIWETVLRPRPEAARVVEAAAGTVRTALLSNTDPWHHAWARRHCAALRWLTPQVVSYAVGACKPAPAIYARATEAVGVPPERIGLVDDREDNCAAARACGWRAIRCTHTEAVSQALRTWDVLGSQT